jgi:hypothetical protein
MKPARFAAFALLLYCSSLSHPQQTSSPPTPPTISSTDAKAADTQQASGPAQPGPAATPQSAAQSPTETAPASSETPQTALDQPPDSFGAQLAGEEINEDNLRRLFLGKQIFLRGLWLSDDLHFNLRGDLVSQSSKGSFTLCAIQIDHVSLSKKRIELEGARYGIHFDDVGNWADQATSFDRIRVTQKKKRLLIVIDRQEVVSLKKEKKKSGHEASQPAPANSPELAAKNETTNPAESAAHLRDAVDRIFAPSLDATMIAAMPDYWQFFYQAQFKHQSIEPTDPAIVRPGPGVTGPTLVRNIVPASNDYAQHAQIAGVASYKVILSPDGKPLAVAVFRPIGFGLDENAVAAIRRSTFTGARKDGKAVSSVIDVDISFRIYSKLTARAGEPGTPDVAPNVSPVTGKPSLPGPYSAGEFTTHQ